MYVGGAPTAQRSAWEGTRRLSVHVQSKSQTYVIDAPYPRRYDFIEDRSII